MAISPWYVINSNFVQTSEWFHCFSFFFITWLCSSAIAVEIKIQRTQNRAFDPLKRWNFNSENISVSSHIGWRGEGNIPYKGVETSSE